ncbi:60S ribosomal protein L4B [Entomophthora muscae]|uniref:60S ribosomal protein L4B n=1 Tax=Entomophthora muscae TaxID=34485 RepID=A0ACC2TKT1_9FUNG|nr:60S ribosomal protein L4B [Entomophthora muscae]
MLLLARFLCKPSSRSPSDPIWFKLFTPMLPRTTVSHMPSHQRQVIRHLPSPGVLVVPLLVFPVFLVVVLTVLVRLLSVTCCRGGRMFAPTKIWRQWHVKTNQNMKRYATCSAIAATAVAPLVLARGHRIEQISEVPLVVASSAEKLQKTKDAVSLLKGLKAYPDIQRVIDSKAIRAGKGKLRNRRYRQRRGPLIVYNKDEGITRAFRNIPGVDLCNVSRLNLLQLAPGGSLGRFVIWTQDAFASLDSIYGTFKEASPKKNFEIPHAICSNPDIKRLINSEEIQAVVRPKRVNDKVKARRGNPLINKKLMYKLNPYAAVVAKHERIHQRKIAALKASGVDYKKSKKEAAKKAKATKA